MMVEQQNIEADARLVDAVERLTKIQKSILDLNQEALRIRNHIRDFDINIEALNILVSIKSRDLQHGGQHVLQDLNIYAEQVGTYAEIGDEGEKADNPVAPPSRPESSSEKNGNHSESPSPLRLVSQLLAAACISLGLFLLVR